MKSVLALITILLLAFAAFSQEPPKSATVPITLDHNWIVIDVYLPLSDGTNKRVRAWVNTGNAKLMMSQRIAALFGPVDCEGQICKVTSPRALMIGGINLSGKIVRSEKPHPDFVLNGARISLPSAQNAYAPAGVPKDVMVPGMSPEISLPSTVLREHDIVIDYANREFTIGEPGTVPFKGRPSRVQINPLGIVQIASQIEGQGHDLVLDTGASISSVSGELLSQLRSAHSSWPFMKGGVGVANMFGTSDETEGSILQVPRVGFGGNILNQVLVASLQADSLKRLRERADTEAVGVLGGDALRNYRVGVDYAHSTVYLERVTNTPATALNVVGLTLRPEPDGRYTVLAIVDVEGKPSVPEVKPGDTLLGIDGAPATGATMGQVWSLLSGSPGQTRSLTLERDGKRFTVDAPVRYFLGSQGAKATTKTSTKAPKKTL
jgi:hypothetical protein